MYFIHYNGFVLHWQKILDSLMFGALIDEQSTYSEAKPMVAKLSLWPRNHGNTPQPLVLGESNFCLPHRRHFTARDLLSTQCALVSFLLYQTAGSHKQINHIQIHLDLHPFPISGVLRALAMVVLLSDFPFTKFGAMYPIQLVHYLTPTYVRTQYRLGFIL